MKKTLHPARALALGYLMYILLGSLFLALPWSDRVSVSWLDHLFTAASAVSTTGLVTVDPGTTYTWFGQWIVLILFQLGGLGYMTTSSFVVLAAKNSWSDERRSILASAFSLPRGIGLTHLVRNIVVFSLISEMLGTLFLYPVFRAEGVEHPLWSAFFHSVSAFCTAGFSLFPSSLEPFRDQMLINMVLTVLSYAGGIGFIVFTDLWSKIKNHDRRITFTSKVIVFVTLITSLGGVIGIFFLEPSIQGLPMKEKFLVALFQAMSASTTVGFNSVPMTSLSLPVIMILYFLMFFGASPAGTGGGLKSTTLTALLGEAWSHLRGYETVCMFGRRIPDSRVRAASMSATTYGMILGMGIFLTAVAMPRADFEWLVFECISAIGTVGMSMGLTGELNAPAKVIMIGLMYIGRLGVITFGLLFVTPTFNETAKNTDLAV
ncbi:MAG: potassium transporter TrkG [Bdellovibrionota bacterium]